MNAAKFIAKSYFFGAMGISALHTVHSFEKLGLHTGEQWGTPLAIDGIAMYGFFLQGAKYDDNTNKIGTRVQICAGIAQLAANLFAASSIGGMLLGIIIVGVYLVMELIGGKIKLRSEAEAEKAAALATAAAEAIATAEAKAREERNAKARNRRAESKKLQAAASRAEASRIRAAEKALKG